MDFHVRVVEGIDIPKMDTIQKCDPFCILHLSNSPNEYRTKVIDNTLSPHWNQDFHFKIPQPDDIILTITMKDKDIQTDELISKIQIPLNTLTPGKVLNQWYTMEPFGDLLKGGRVHLIMHIATPGQPPFIETISPLYLIKPEEPKPVPPKPTEEEQAHEPREEEPKPEENEDDAN